MTVEYYDRYSSSGFWFGEKPTDRRYCLSMKGDENRDCLPDFTGSLAIARYRVRSRSPRPDVPVLRERVRTIDQDGPLNERPPYESRLVIQAGSVSDIQAFGYQPSAPPPAQPHEPWCLFRQDLYFGDEPTAFLILHWKHMLSAIRILDVIPGDGTRQVNSFGLAQNNQVKPNDTR